MHTPGARGVGTGIASVLLLMWFRSGSAALIIYICTRSDTSWSSTRQTCFEIQDSQMKSHSFIESNLFSSVLFEVLKWVYLVKETCFGCALFSLCCLSFPVPSTFDTKFYRNHSHKTIPSVCFASLKSRYFRPELRAFCFCENVFRCGFLFVLNP